MAVPLIHLRPVLPSDVPFLYQFQLDAESNVLAATKPRDAETFNAVWARVIADPAAVQRAIVVGETVVGSIGLHKHEGRDAVGFWIDRRYWGKGIAGRALALLLQKVSIRPLVARAARANAASIRVLERNGFRVSGYEFVAGTERFCEGERVMMVLE